MMSKSDVWLKRLSSDNDLSLELLTEYLHLFGENDIPVLRRRRKTKNAVRIVAISTHGYWSDPPPAGVPDLVLWLDSNDLNGDGTSGGNSEQGAGTAVTVRRCTSPSANS